MKIGGSPYAVCRVGGKCVMNAIHILVNNRTVTLAGVVDSEGDKTLAGLKARGVMNVNQVNNDLEVATKS